MKTFIRNTGLALMIAAGSGAVMAGKNPSPGVKQVTGSVVITPAVSTAISNAVAQTLGGSGGGSGGSGGGTAMSVKTTSTTVPGASKAVTITVTPQGGVPVNFTASLTGTTVTITNSAGAVVDTIQI